MSVHYSSARADWSTPDGIFKPLDAEFEFTLDAAASTLNAKCARYYTAEDDALNKPWFGTVWVNPPFGRGVTWRWVEKAIQSANEGAVVVMLVPARTDSIWFQQLLTHATEVRLVSRRVTFVGATKPAPFPTAIVVLRRDCGWTSKQLDVNYKMPKRHDNRLWTVVRAEVSS